MKRISKLLITTLIVFGVTSVGAKTISKDDCLKKDAEEFIYAGGECINYFEEEGDSEGMLNIVIHGAWKDGTNTLARYSPFASDLSMNTDITTVAVALPSYSKSSSNNFEGLLHNSKKPKGSTNPEYVKFLANLIEALKAKYEAKTVNVIAHSAGAILTASVTGYKPGLIQNAILAGGQYDLRKYDDKKNKVTVDTYINNIPKSTNFLLVYGTTDKISKPQITKDFYKKLQKRGINSKIIEVNQGHLDLDMSDDSKEAIATMFESE